MKKKCFVIGPMSDEHMPLLNWLAHDVVCKILDPKEYDVTTPDAPETGNIMQHIIRWCDRAQLVIADTTGNNPNVWYEIAILDAMGRACIPIKMKMGEDKDQLPFDRAHYRSFEVDPNDTYGAIKILEQVIRNVLGNHENGDLQTNPLTDYFGVPLSSLSSAHGVARSYFTNLLKPAMKGVVIDGPEKLKGLKELKFVTLIPNRLLMSSREGVEKLIKGKIITPVTIEAKGRPLGMTAWASEYLAENPDRDELTIVDMPTTLGTLYNNVGARLGSAVNIDTRSEEFMKIEQDEILQFKRYLKSFVSREADLTIQENFRTLDITFEDNRFFIEKISMLT